MKQYSMPLTHDLWELFRFHINNIHERVFCCCCKHYSVCLLPTIAVRLDKWNPTCHIQNWYVHAAQNMIFVWGREGGGVLSPYMRGTKYEEVDRLCIFYQSLKLYEFLLWYVAKFWNIYVHSDLVYSVGINL